jgi:ankyrin repeat protein
MAKYRSGFLLLHLTLNLANKDYGIMKLKIIVLLIISIYSCSSTLETEIRNGNASGVKEFIDSKVDINSKDESGATPLMIAALEGQVDIIKLLLNEKAEVNAKDENGWTPLMIATTNGYDEVVELLISAKADVNSRDINNGTALILATYVNNVKIVKLLINAKADVNAMDLDGRTPMKIARSSPYYDEVSKLLKNAGAK